MKMTPHKFAQYACVLFTMTAATLALFSAAGLIAGNAVLLWNIAGGGAIATFFTFILL